MTLHRCEWIWSPRLKTFAHSIQTSRGEPWKAVELAPDEVVYWRGRPQRVCLRWGALFLPLLGLTLIWFACFELMSIFVTGLGIFCLICAFLNFLNLKYAIYLLTDRRICIDNTFFRTRREYDLLSYFRDYKGEFSYCTWQPGNRWDFCVIRSALYDGHNTKFVFFHSILKEDLASIKRAEREIRARHNVPVVDPRYRTSHTICRWFK